MFRAEDELRQLRQVLEIAPGKEWEATIRLLLRLMGEDPQREGLRRTPLRVKQSLQFLTAGSGSIRRRFSRVASTSNKMRW